MATGMLVATILFFIGQASEQSAPAPADAARSEPIGVRYSRAQLQLAEANLQRVQQMNRRLARTVPASVVSEYQHDLEEAKAQFQQAESPVGEDGFAIWLRRAESIWKSADTLWKNAVAINQRSKGTFENLDIERFRLRAEVTRLQLERGQLLVRAPHDAQLEWQLEVVNNEVQQLKEESRGAAFSRFWKVWWW